MAMDCVGPRHKQLMQDLLNGTGTPKSLETTTSGGTAGQRTSENSRLQQLQGRVSSIEAELELVKTAMEKELKSEMEAMSNSIHENWIQISALAEAVRKPPELPMQLFQQFHDRLAMQERRQKEQDEQVRKILERLSVQASPIGLPRQSTEEESSEAHTLLRLLKESKKSSKGKDSEFQRLIEELSPQTPVSPRTDRTTPSNAATKFGASQEDGTEWDVDEAQPRPDVSFNISEQTAEITQSGGLNASTHSRSLHKKRPEVLRQTKTATDREEQFRVGGNRRVKAGVPAQPKPFKAGASASSIRTGHTSGRKGPYASEEEMGAEKKKALTEPLAPPEELEWSGSIWEMSLFIGTPGTTMAASVHMFILLLVNIFTQVAFAFIAFVNFTQPVFGQDTLDQVLHFREAVGHDVKYQDTITRSSLMSQICAGGMADLPFGTMQADVLDRIGNYKGEGEESLQAIFAGGLLMCTLALFCWSLVYVIELERATTWSMAVLKVKRLRITSLLVNGEGDIEVEGFSGGRFIFLAVILILRYLISSFLLVCGCFWLAYTVDVPSLLLNTVALGFVLDLDDMLFSLAPMQFKSLVARLKPLPAHSWPSFMGCDMLAVAYSAFVPTIAFIFYFAILAPQVNDMTTIEDALCGGELDFVYAEDSFGLTYVSPAAPLDVSEPRARLIRAAVEEAIAGVALWATSSFQVAFVADEFASGDKPAWEVSGMEVHELVDMFNPLCQEGAWNWYPQLKLTFGNKIGIHNDSWKAITCANQEHHWSQDTDEGMFLRMVCPISSGCANALSPLFSLSPTRGCPSRCGGQVEEQVASFPCEDRDVRGEAYWQAWAQYVGKLSGAYERDEEAVVASLLRNGCEAIEAIENLTYPAFTKLGLCTGTEWAVHPFAYACPIACGCGGDDVPFGLVESCPMECLEEDEEEHAEAGA